MNSSEKENIRVARTVGKMLTYSILVDGKPAEVGVFKIAFLDSYLILYITTMWNIWPLLRFMKFYPDLNSCHVTRTQQNFRYNRHLKTYSSKGKE